MAGDKDKLKATLRSTIREYGIERINECLREIESSDHRLRVTARCNSSINEDVAIKSKKKKSSPTATEYASKMKLPAEKESIVLQVAEKFQDKSFLPTIADIRNFCQIYGIDKPASSSRVNAIPRVFRFIATMESEKIQRMLTDNMFCGPAKLGPIADAIRSAGRSRYDNRSNDSMPAHNTTN